jgi:ParB-like chromosome segregation protein Spo0J
VTTERYFVDLGVGFERVPALPLDEIDDLKSLTNQARVKPLDEPTVERYTLDLDAGDVFPPIVVRRRNTRSKLVLIGGNHRYAAHKRASRATIDAYVVECDDLTAVRMTYEDNRNHGLTLTDDERVAHATHLVDLGWKQAAAARLVGLDQQKLQRAIGATRADRRALELGVDVQAFTRIAKTGRWRLDQVKDDTVFVAAAQLAIDARLGPEELFPLVTELNAAEEPLQVLAERRKHWADRIRFGAHMKKSSPRGKLNDACFTVTTLPVAAIVESCATAEERLALARRCSDAVTHLGKVIAKLHVKTRTA